MRDFFRTAQGPVPQIDWRVERDRIALARVATELMGSPPGRGRDPLWWVCPFHDDRNPSLRVDPARQRWKCFGCGAKGDAATLVMRLSNLTFPEAIRQLTGGPLGLTTYRSTPQPQPARPAGPSGLSASEALSLVAQSHARLWTAAGSARLAYLITERHLTEATIRHARLGWTPGVKLPTAAGGEWTVRGWTIPWFDGDRLTMMFDRPQVSGLRVGVVVLGIKNSSQTKRPATPARSINEGKAGCWSTTAGRLSPETLTSSFPITSNPFHIAR